MNLNFIDELYTDKYRQISEKVINGIIVREFIHNLPPEETEKRRQEIGRKLVKIINEYEQEKNHALKKEIYMKNKDIKFISSSGNTMTVEINGYTVDWTFLGKKTVQECLENIIDAHMYCDKEGNYINLNLL